MLDPQRSEQVQRDREACVPAELSPVAQWELDRNLARWHISPSDHVLDVGCGPGELVVRYAQQCQQVVAIDFSFRSLQLLAQRLERPRNTRLAQANALALPFRAAQFDAVICSQLIEHLPSPVLRRGLVAELARVLKPRGRLVLSAYNYNLVKRFAGAAVDRAGKEGFHSEGRIYYYNFTRRELIRLLAEQFCVQECAGIRNHVPKLSRLLGRHEPWLNRGIERTPFGSLLGWLLVAVGVKRDDRP